MLDLRCCSTKTRPNLIGVLLNYHWILYYTLTSFDEKINFFYTQGLLNKESSFFSLALVSWSMGALIFLKISHSVIFFDKNIIKNTFIIALFAPCFILSFCLFSGLFLGHSKPVYLTNFTNFNYLVEDIIFLVVCIILYFFTYYKNILQFSSLR